MKSMYARQLKTNLQYTRPTNMPSSLVVPLVNESIEANSHSEAAASTAPAPLNEAWLLTTTSTGYFHCMNRVQPAVH